MMLRELSLSPFSLLHTRRSTQCWMLDGRARATLIKAAISQLFPVAPCTGLLWRSLSSGWQQLLRSVYMPFGGVHCCGCPSLDWRGTAYSIRAVSNTTGKSAVACLPTPSRRPGPARRRFPIRYPGTRPFRWGEEEKAILNSSSYSQPRTFASL